MYAYTDRDRASEIMNLLSLLLLLGEGPCDPRQIFFRELYLVVTVWRFDFYSTLETHLWPFTSSAPGAFLATEVWRGQRGWPRLYSGQE